MKKLIRNSTAEFLIFTSQAGEDSIEVRVENETVWLTQKLIAELFGKSVSTINEHIKNIYADNELDESASLRKFGNSEFSTKPTNFYNLDMIISVGYRVNSKRAIQFRQWATQVLREFASKVMCWTTNIWKMVSFWARIILKDCWLKSAKSGSVDTCSIKKLLIFMPPVWVTADRMKDRHK